MSGRVTFWAWDQPIKPAATKYVLLCLANCHNESTGRCDPSIHYIAEKTGLNIKTIPGAILRLSEMGLLAVQKRGKRSPMYSFPMTQNRGYEYPEMGVYQNRGMGTPKKGKTEPPKLGHESKKESKKNLKYYRSLDCADIPLTILQPIKEFIDHRINLKKPMTQAALSRLVTSVEKTAKELELTSETVITETIDAGWQSVKTEWLRSRLGTDNDPARSGRHTRKNEQANLTPAQRTQAIREQQRQLEERSSDVGIMGEDGRDVWPSVGLPTGGVS